MNKYVVDVWCSFFTGLYLIKNNQNLNLYFSVFVNIDILFECFYFFSSCAFFTVLE